MLLVRLSASSAIKVRINVKHRISDRLRSRSASELRFELVRVRVSYVILRENNRCAGATSVTFRAGIAQF